jgi:hypothetical protein
VHVALVRMVPERAGRHGNDTPDLGPSGSHAEEDEE